MLPRIDFFCDEVGDVLGDERVLTDPEQMLSEVIRHEPLGVVANISAWNYPWFVGSNVFVPALLCGNAVVYKPSEHATLTGVAIARLLHEAGVPDDVFTTLVGAGDVGGALVAQPVDGVFFTGSYATGRRIAEAVAARMIRLQLELGGKDPVYVTDDVPVADVAAAVADGAFYNTGQSCCSVERIYVHRSIHDEFVEAFVATVGGFVAGDPTDDATYIGPLTRAPQLDVLEAQVADAVAKGATVRTGGTRGDGTGGLVPTHGRDRGRPHDVGHAGRELRPDHRHPGGRRRRRGARAHERHRVRAHRRRVLAQPRPRRGAVGGRRRRLGLLELLRPGEPPPPVDRPPPQRDGLDAVDPRHPRVHPTEGVPPAVALTDPRVAAVTR